MQPWYKRSTAKEIKPLPWLADEAISYFESILTPQMTVLEFGGGGSTLWLAQRVKEVVTVEAVEEWADAIRAVAPDNVDVCLGVASTSPEFDLLFLDGEPIEERGTWLNNVKEYVKPGGYVVLDNANRPEFYDERLEFTTIADLLHVVKSPGGLYFVTEFWRVK